MKDLKQISVLCKVDPQLVAKVQKLIAGRTMTVEGVSHGRPITKTVPMGVSNFFVEAVERAVASVKLDDKTVASIRRQRRKAEKAQPAALDEAASERHRLHASASFFRARIKKLSVRGDDKAREALAVAKRRLAETEAAIQALPDRRRKS